MTERSRVMVRRGRIQKHHLDGSDGRAGIPSICVLGTWRYMSRAGRSAAGNTLRVISVSGHWVHWREGILRGFKRRACVEKSWELRTHIWGSPWFGVQEEDPSRETEKTTFGRQMEQQENVVLLNWEKRMSSRKEWWAVRNGTEEHEEMKTENWCDLEGGHWRPCKKQLPSDWKQKPGNDRPKCE